MRKYAITMTIRMLCIAAMPFVSGWWILVCAAGAVFLPYFAVVVANVKNNSMPDETHVEHATLELEDTNPRRRDTAGNQDEPPLIIAGEESIRVRKVEKYE